MANGSGTLSRRRGQKQRDDGHQRRVSTMQSQPTSKTSPANNVRADTIRTHIKRLDKAKRRVRQFNKLALCIAVVCVGRNIFTILSKAEAEGVTQHHHHCLVGGEKHSNSSTCLIVGRVEKSIYNNGLLCLGTTMTMSNSKKVIVMKSLERCYSHLDRTPIFSILPLKCEVSFTLL